MKTTGCEGGCGMLLAEDGREQNPWLLYRNDHGPQHTPSRCVLERALRAAAEAAFPHWSVEIDPGPARQPLITVRLRFETAGRVYGAAYTVLDGPTDISPEQRAEWAVLALNAQVMRELPADRTLPAPDQTLRA